MQINNEFTNLQNAGAGILFFIIGTRKFLVYSMAMDFGNGNAGGKVPVF